MVAEKLGSKGQAWFCTTGLPSDVVVKVEEMIFHVHKFPLMSKSRKLHRLITEQEENPGERGRIRRAQNGGDDDAESREEEEKEEEEAEEAEEGQREAEEDEIKEEKEGEEPGTRPICLPDFPGGPETFEGAAKFCYGVNVELTSWNVAPLRCAAEYLEMTEEFAEDNLVSRTERFLAQSILRNLRESVRALKSCEDLVPLAEDLGIVQRCIDSIAARATSSDPGSLFGWPVNDRHGGASNAVLWNGIDTGIRRRGGILSSSSSAAAAAAASSADSWFEALTILSLPMYKRVIAALKARDLGSEAMEAALVSYAKRSIPGLSRSTTTRRHASAPVASETEQRELLETVITNLPPEKSLRLGRTTTRLLFGLLRTVNILRASEASRTALERKIASQLEQATLDDLLIPSFSYLAETLYDVDCVQRILGHFLQGLQEAEAEEESSSAVFAADEEEEEDRGARILPRAGKLTAVGKLVDGYLAEIASDTNLTPDGFCELALALPDRARVFYDGLYRAVDIYLKVRYVSFRISFIHGVFSFHPVFLFLSILLLFFVCPRIDGLNPKSKFRLHAITTRTVKGEEQRDIVHSQAHPRMREEERERVCGVVDCRKLTLEACTHAAQNERLPLRAVVQVLFFEQLQLRQAIAGTLLAAEQEASAAASAGRTRGGGRVVGGGGDTSAASLSRRTAERENQVLRLDMDSMRSRVQELERECASMKKAIAKMDGPGRRGGGRPGVGGARRRGTRMSRLGCRFSTQVCDSHERTVVESKSSRLEELSP
ncbi:BTB/POZ domain-containing protein At1g30440-like isoform X1 [Phoenix dactylifera]|uniref:BTB/POZ domain-containing protein At1g30440-like isoform X1 n=1 Tax=Phoenix dactylifera TaxID=42345 RepID=A0A8B8J0N9_PHODC|nr:BTB/POZ domain-containing protein At1g30440-like isoform X1 [Phoenix dactylifera]